MFPANVPTTKGFPGMADSESGERKLRMVERTPESSAPTLSEKTRISLQVGGIVAILLVGRYWGSWETTSEHTGATLARHETSISDLYTRLSNMERILLQIQGEQASSKETISTTARNSTALLYEMGNIKVALAQKGIIVKPGD